MSVLKDALEALKKVILIEDRILSMSGKVERLAVQMVEMDKRLVALEAKFDMMMQMAAGRGAGSTGDGAAPPMIESGTDPHR